jgi:hypothetical protein
MVCCVFASALVDSGPWKRCLLAVVGHCSQRLTLYAISATTVHGFDLPL